MTYSNLYLHILLSLQPLIGICVAEIGVVKDKVARSDDTGLEPP